MDLDQLHTFLEIVRLKSFSKAALTCYRTQPAISAQIRQMEQELNCSLFERLGTRIELTAAGKILSEYAGEILDLRRRFWKHRQRFSQLLAALGDLKKPPQTKFRTGQQTARAA